MSGPRAPRPSEATHPLEMAERDWVARIRSGDGTAFEALFHAYHAPLCAFAYRPVGVRDLAEEIVQEVFLYISERRETWDVRTSVESYLFTAVRNAAMSYLRHERVVRQREGKSGHRRNRIWTVGLTRGTSVRNSSHVPTPPAREHRARPGARLVRADL